MHCCINFTANGVKAGFKYVDRSMSERSPLLDVFKRFVRFVPCRARGTKKLSLYIKAFFSEAQARLQEVILH